MHRRDKTFSDKILPGIQYTDLSTHVPLPSSVICRKAHIARPTMVLQGAAMTSGWDLFIPFFSNPSILPTAIPSFLLFHP